MLINYLHVHFSLFEEFQTLKIKKILVYKHGVLAGRFIAVRTMTSANFMELYILVMERNNCLNIS